MGISYYNVFIQRAQLCSETQSEAEVVYDRSLLMHQSGLDVLLVVHSVIGCCTGVQQLTVVMSLKLHPTLPSL